MLNILGVAVGGTFVRMGTLKDGKVENLVKRSSAESFSAPGGAAAGLASALKEYAGDTQFAAVGVGIPGTVSRDGERVLNVPNIPGLNDTPLRDALTDALNCPVFVENDITMLDGADFAFCPADGIVADRYPNVCNCQDGAVADVIYKKIPEILRNKP